MLFVTTAPAPASYTRAMDPPVSSRNPEARIVGFRSRTPAISVRRSTIGRTELMDVLKALGPANRRVGPVDLSTVRQNCRVGYPSIYCSFHALTGRGKSR